jgi:hypothetical protein
VADEASELSVTDTTAQAVGRRVAVEEMAPSPRKPKPTLVEMKKPERTDGPPEQAPSEERTVREPPQAAAPEARFVDVMRVLSMILSARAIFAAAVAGAFVLGVIATLSPDWKTLVALALYGMVAVGPAAWLEIRRPK